MVVPGVLVYDPERYTAGLHGSRSGGGGEGAHVEPWEVKSTSLERLIPPWSVRSRVWSDSLVANHSGISTDTLLFSDVHLSLTHHYRVHKCGRPHVDFRADYLTRLRAAVSPAAGRSRGDPMSPVVNSPVSMRHARVVEHDSGTSRLTRRCRRRMWPVRGTEESVGDLQALTGPTPLDLQGTLTHDRRLPLLSLCLQDIGLLPLYQTVASASRAVLPQ